MQEDNRKSYGGVAAMPVLAETTSVKIDSSRSKKSVTCAKNSVLFFMVVSLFVAANRWWRLYSQEKNGKEWHQEEWYLAVWTSSDHWTLASERGSLRLRAHGVVCAAARYTLASDHISGFGEFTVETRGHSECSAKQRAQAVGYLEGILTAREIAATAKNLACEVACDGSIPPPLAQFFHAHEEWLSRQRNYTTDPDPIRRHAALVLEQYHGLKLGYSQSPLGMTGSAASHDLRLINYLGDLFDIIPAVEKNSREDFADESGDKASKTLEKHGHCSALIKLTTNNRLIFGHVAWFHYSNMVRIYKHYNVDFGDHHQNKRSSLSSYPGMLSSLDDFYLMHDTKLVMLQTTNGIYNTSLYDAVTPFAFPAWIRVRTANALATNGKDWAAILAFANSGTYNNQYDIIDLKRKESSGLLTIVEQIPGLVEARDLTQQLNKDRYFLSYNVPSIPKIYRLSGYPSLDEKRGRPEGSEYTQAPRAQLARRDQHTVETIDDAKRFLRSNHYGTGDPIATDPWFAICSRGDLVHPNAKEQPTLAGCYDGKISSDSLFEENGAAWIINGPTNQQQPTFSWQNVIKAPGPIQQNNTWKEVINLIVRNNHTTVPIQGSASHISQSSSFDFQFELVSPPRAWFS